MKRTFKQRNEALPDGRFNITGERIKQIRVKKNITQTQLAERLQGVSFDQKTISSIEVGNRTISDFELLAIADGLGVSLLELYEPAEPTTKTQQVKQPKQKIKNRKNQISCDIIGENLVALMNDRRMTMLDTKKQTGIGMDTIRRMIEHRGFCKMATVKKLADGLGVDVADLIKKPSTNA